MLDSHQVVASCLPHNKNIQSPLDGIDEILNLVTAEPQHPEDNRNIDAIG